MLVLVYGSILKGVFVISVCQGRSLDGCYDIAGVGARTCPRTLCST